MLSMVRQIVKQRGTDKGKLAFIKPADVRSNYNTVKNVSFSLFFIGRELTTWPANNRLQISVLLQVIFYSYVIETTLSCENGGSAPRSGREWFDIFSWSKERWSNDKTIAELGYRKIINYLPKPKEGWGKKLICPPLTNHDILLNLAQPNYSLWGGVQTRNETPLCNIE